MTATYTSLVGYRTHVLDGKATSQRNRILTCLFESAVPLTRLQISKITRIRLTSVCGRVTSMIDRENPERSLIHIAYEAEDPDTGKLAEFLGPAWPQPMQKEVMPSDRLGNPPTLPTSAESGDPHPIEHAQPQLKQKEMF